MNLKQQEFLEDTRDILVGYDGCGTVDSLKELIDEARERIHFAATINFDSYPRETNFNDLFYEMDVEKRRIQDERMGNQ